MLAVSLGCRRQNNRSILCLLCKNSSQLFSFVSSWRASLSPSIGPFIPECLRLSSLVMARLAFLQGPCAPRLATHSWHVGGQSPLEPYAAKWGPLPSIFRPELCSPPDAITISTVRLERVFDFSYFYLNCWELILCFSSFLILKVFVEVQRLQFWWLLDG